MQRNIISLFLIVLLVLSLAYCKRRIFLKREILKPVDVSESDWNRFLTAHEARKASNQEIRFFGKVVDQDGNPVEGVKIPTEIRSRETSLVRVLKEGRDQIMQKEIFETDSAGLFFIGKRKGNSISIQDFKKEGYQRPVGQRTHYMFGQVMKNSKEPGFHNGDSANPVTYVMWKKGNTEPLIKTGARLRFSKNASYKSLYFLFDGKSKPSPNSIGIWDVKMTGYNNGKTDWEVSLEAMGQGGFLISKDIHMNYAPLNGYEKTLKFTSTDLNYNESDLENIGVYYKGDKATKYAAFRLSYARAPNAGDSFSLYLRDLKINPNGSRNLEYDPVKRIKK